ncbi:DUF1822 family protein [Microcoleus sp. LEGE 07076]|uniref:DUF1822 family protein n=1 Tax=Microcoleus sp. LEGE 07076 TaxID=915322 RepID=UPI001881AC4E|nr:DUF1822 family protein [Microcoleus sp. LEGE 07076]MBE9183310.1 DUF1822 family protein [Microcoleus sp. LEGE 07076]
MTPEELKEKAGKNWNLDQLLSALNQAKMAVLMAEDVITCYRTLTREEVKYLYGILDRKNPAEIAQIYDKNPNNVRNQLTRLYRYIKKLLNYSEVQDIRSINIPDELANRNFRINPLEQPRETDRVWWRITIELDNPDNLQLQAIVNRLGSVLEKPLIVQKIDQGSTLLVFESDRSEYDRIEALYRSDRLGELLKVTVSDLGQIPQDSLLIYVRQMYESIFGEGYQPVALILTRNQRNRSRGPNPENSESVARAKQINFGTNQSVNLTVELTPKDEESDTKIWIDPCGEAVYLPVGLQITVLDEFGDAVPQLQKQTGTTDNAVLLTFSLAPGEQFSVKLLLGDASVTETF